MCRVWFPYVLLLLVVVYASVTDVVRFQVESLTRKVLADAAFVQIRGEARPFENMQQ